jgi:thiamine-monophosphate kinase
MTKASDQRSLLGLGEFGLIQSLQRQFGKTGRSVLKGIGDDTAIIQPAPHTSLLLTTDLLTEGIHFDLHFQTLEDVGYKTAVANLSDIAAMGGTPLYLLISLAIPKIHQGLSVQSLYKGIMGICKTHGVQLIGGDTSGSRRDFMITGTLVGQVKPQHALQRCGAQVGDRIYVTGTLGDSRAGLSLLQKRVRSSSTTPLTKTEKFLVKRHLRPIPRLEVGQALATHQLATAAIDISDGFSGDIHHLCQASGVGALIWEKTIPLSGSCSRYCTQHKLNPIQFALAGGEDYELAFTSPPTSHHKLTRLAKKLSLSITCVGEVQPQVFGIQLKLKGGKNRKLLQTSFDHFRP